MFNYHVSFDSPWYLLLLAVLPVLWWLSFRTLAGMGKWRRISAIALRTVVLVLFVLAAAEIQVVRTSDRLTVIYLLDQSQSIPAERRVAMINYVNAAIAEHRKRDDRAGVIVFGREAAIEIPPFDDAVSIGQGKDAKIESLLDPDYTNLAGALKLAQASFPADAAKRIVIVSDGNQNIGDAVEQARGAVDAGIGIDVQPIVYQSRAEVSVEKIALPSDVRKGQPFDLRVVVNNSAQATETDPGNVGGRLIVSQQTGDQPVVLSDEHVVLPPGKKVFTLRQQIDAPNFYTYDARFVPDQPADDSMPQNNRATTFTHVRGSGQVLLIENQNPEERGQFDFLVDRLRKENLEVTVRSTAQMFSSLAELQQFDTVLLANTPREQFSDEQIQMLVRNTQNLGSGLMMLGGSSSLGAGGWTNTELEAAMPVDFQIKSAKDVPKGALAQIMHASEIPEGNYWQKVIAKEAIKALGSEDYAGVIHWNGNDQWLWGGMTRVSGQRERMLGAIDRMFPGDMPQFDPALIMVQQAMVRLQDATVKHLVVISDGDPSQPSGSVVQGFVQAKITVSTVAVAAHGQIERNVLQNLAKQTGGQFYEVTNPAALPKIFQREARRVARPLIHENAKGFQPRVKYPHEMIAGVDSLPPITGYVMSTVKQNPLVEVSLVAPEPAGEENSTILASWTYGLGRAAVLTTDAGSRWATQWTGWGNYDKFFSQIVRWSMRPSGDQGKFTVSTDVADGKVRVFVTALDKDDRFLNFLNVQGTAIGPDMKTTDVKLEQTAPGRYVGAFDAKDAGSYFVMLTPGADQAPIRTGVNVPYSAEFKDREADEALLKTLAALRPKNGSPGVVIEDLTGRGSLEELLKTNTFRHDLPKATSSQDVWQYLLWLSGGLFFFDVFVRRVAVSFAWAPPLAVRVRDRLLGRQPPPPASEYMDRLRTRKEEVSQQLEQQRAAARFEPSPDAVAEAPELSGAAQRPLPLKQPPSSKSGLAPEQQKEQESYTSRLLKAKQKVWEERKKEKE